MPELTPETIRAMQKSNRWYARSIDEEDLSNIRVLPCGVIAVDVGISYEFYTAAGAHVRISEVTSDQIFQAMEAFTFN